MTMPPTELTFTVQGMDCASCARTVESGVAQLPGVELCELTFATERLRVRGTIAREDVVRRVRDLGYDVAEASQPDAAPAPAPGFLGFMWARLETRLALLGALLVLPGVVLTELLGREAIWIDALALAAMALTIVPIARSAWRALAVNRELNIDALMTIAAAGAVAIGAYVEAGLVMVLFTIGEALEGYTATRARHAIKSLMEVAPQTAVRVGAACCESGCEERVPIAALQVGDMIAVRPGERIPMDGEVRAGRSAVNQAPITGESRLIEKEPGDEVFAGSVNGEGSLEVAVTRLAADNTIARMIRLVEEAQERRAPVQRFVDRFARYYTPAVVVLALLVAAVPPLLLGQPFWNPAPGEFGWLYRALALLVVACPCALVISTPVSLVSAMSAAARGGVLIKGGAFLEALSRVRAVAFDKTGTLTAGRPAVVAVRSLGCPAGAGGDRAAGPCDSCDELLALAGAVERRSEHPLAHAIVTASAERGAGGRLPAAEGVTALVGRGVAGLVAGREVLVGSHRHFDTAVAHDPAHCAAAAQDAAAGHTPVMVSVAGSYLGTITLADTVRASSREAVAQLKGMGLRAVVMLTGDQRATAERIAAEVGVSDVRAELLPEQKVAAVEALEREYGPVAMVGDGINDTPALAAASVGIAVGAAHGGSNQAMETADVTLMGDDLRRLPFAIGLGRAAMRTVTANIAFSIGLKLVFLVLVLLGLGTMWMAVLADVGTSLLVTLNGMRLLRYRDNGQADR
jgi:Cd2+/Zn2+-exporting ATPase